MIPSINLNPEFTNSLKDVYDIKVDEMEELQGNENLVFATGNNIIRLTSPYHRTSKDLDAEVELLNLLDFYGCSVVKIIDSNRGKQYEEFCGKDGGFYITLFRRINGVNPDIQQHAEREKIIYEWGRSMGQIHRITSEIVLKTCNNRLNWDKEIVISQANQLLPEKDAEVRIAFWSLLRKIKSLPVNTSNYGLVHTDMRPRNFGYDQGKVTHFDFDNICHHWFMYDISAAAFNETEGYLDVDKRTEFLKLFLNNLLHGYLCVKPLTQEMLESLILLMKLRCIYAYIDYYKRIKIEKRNLGKENMQIRRGYILDFDKFINTEEVKKELLQYQKN